MSLDGSWWGGETEFLYTEDPLTEEEFLSKVVKDRNMRHKLFDRMDKEMSSNKPSDEQTSDSFGKTGPSKLLFSFFQFYMCYWAFINLMKFSYMYKYLVTKKLIKINFENENRMSLNCGFVASLYLERHPLRIKSKDSNLWITQYNQLNNFSQLIQCLKKNPMLFTN